MASVEERSCRIWRRRRWCCTAIWCDATTKTVWTEKTYTIHKTERHSPLSIRQIVRLIVLSRGPSLFQACIYLCVCMRMCVCVCVWRAENAHDLRSRDDWTPFAGCGWHNFRWLCLIGRTRLSICFRCVITWRRHDRRGRSKVVIASIYIYTWAMMMGLLLMVSRWTVVVVVIIVSVGICVVVNGVLFSIENVRSMRDRFVSDAVSHSEWIYAPAK